MPSRSSASSSATTTLSDAVSSSDGSLPAGMGSVRAMGIWAHRARVGVSPRSSRKPRGLSTQESGASAPRLDDVPGPERGAAGGRALAGEAHEREDLRDVAGADRVVLAPCEATAGEVDRADERHAEGRCHASVGRGADGRLARVAPDPLADVELVAARAVDQGVAARAADRAGGELVAPHPPARVGGDRGLEAANQQAPALDAAAGYRDDGVV